MNLEELKAKADEVGIEFPMFKTNVFDRIALRQAKKSLLNGETRWLCLAIPFWSWLLGTKRKIDKSLTGGSILESKYPSFMDLEDSMIFYKHKREMRILWIIALLAQEEDQ